MAREPVTRFAAAIEQAITTARAAWPAIAIDPSVVASRLADRAPPGRDPIAWLANLPIADVYLAIGCELGDPAAIAAFERTFMPEIATYLGRGQRGSADEIAQRVREALLTGERPKIASYAGRGPLAGWLRVVATRIASNARRADQAAARAEHRAGEAQATAIDPELDFLKARYRPLFREALEASIRALPPKRRNMFRLYFLDHLTLAQIGKLFRLHESSIARQIEATRRDLLDHTRRELVERHGLRRSEADSIIGLVRSRADLALSSVLAPIE